MTAFADIPAPPANDGGPGSRARVRAYRLELLRAVLAEADRHLRFDDVVDLLREADGVGIPRRTLTHPPFVDLISAQTPRRGSNGELSGLPWRLRRLSGSGRAALAARLETRLRAMGLDVGKAASAVSDGAIASRSGDRSEIEYLMSLESAVERVDAEHRLAIAASMRALFVVRRDEARLLRAAALSRAHDELRRPAPSGRRG